MSELLGIIGGSGLYSMAEFKLEQEIVLETPFGSPSDAFMKGTIDGNAVIFLPRHGRGHVISPSELNFRANIWGMKKLGVTSIVSISAVGSLREEIEPGHMVVIDQFFDRTKGRISTFFSDGLVAHVALADPVCQHVRKALIECSKKAEAVVHEKGTYVCMEGPQFSTRAESHFYRQINADVIGMTNLQEAKLAREAEICYATLALSTDYDCWFEGHDDVTTDQILQTLHQNVAMAQKIVRLMAAELKGDSQCSCRHALAHAILTDKAKVKKNIKDKLEIIVGKYLN